MGTHFTFIDIVIVAILIFWMALDRMRTTFGRRFRHSHSLAASDYCFATLMIILYLSIAFLSIFNFLTSPHNLQHYLFGLIGLLIFLFGRWIRNLAILTLGRNWSIGTSAGGIKRVIQIGVYQYSRHPYYLATWLELLGFVMASRSWMALWLLLFCLIPVSIYRIGYEENGLLKKFGVVYMKYQKETARFFSCNKFLRGKISNSRPVQIFRLISHYGFAHILKMSYVNRHIVRDARGYMLSSCLGALFEVGFMEDIIEKSKVDLSDFSEKQRLDPYYLRAICDYLYILGFLNREGENYSLSIAGLKLVTEARGVFDLLYAYFPIFENLVFLLKKEKEYGKDVLRRGRYVAKGTAELASYLPFPEVRLILQKYGIKSVLDLGCGSADFLISVCLKDQITGLGIDINEDAILYARERVQKAGANNLIKLAVGDMFHLEKLPTEFKKAEAISIMFALHEFLYEGIHKVVEMLDQIKAILPNRYVLIAELCKQSVETLRAKPSGIAEHHLFHAISKQGFASYNLWCRIFKAAQLSVVEDLRFDFSGQGYFLLKS